MWRVRLQIEIFKGHLSIITNLAYYEILNQIQLQSSSTYLLNTALSIDHKHLVGCTTAWCGGLLVNTLKPAGDEYTNLWEKRDVEFEVAL